MGIIMIRKRLYLCCGAYLFMNKQFRVSPRWTLSLTPLTSDWQMSQWGLYWQQRWIPYHLFCNCQQHISHGSKNLFNIRILFQSIMFPYRSQIKSSQQQPYSRTPMRFLHHTRPESISFVWVGRHVIMSHNSQHEGRRTKCVFSFTW